MKHTFITFILLSLCIFTYAQKKIAREYIEWSDIWIPGANKTDLPHVLLIGNSITRGYYGKVEAALKEKAYVGRLSNSKSVGDPALIEEIQSSTLSISIMVCTDSIIQKKSMIKVSQN